MPSSTPDAPWTPTLRQLEVLRAVVNLGSLAKAADALHVSQPSITQTLAQLESGCGVELLSRRHGRVTPAAAARALLGDIDEVFGAMERVSARFDALRAPQPGELRVACLHALSTAVLPDVAAQFRRLFPEVRLLLLVESSRAIRDALVAGQVDFAVVGDEVDLGGLTASPFYGVAAVCAVPARHRLARRARVTPQDLAGEALITLAPQDRARQAMQQAYEQAGVPWQPMITTPYSLTQCELVISGAGVAITNPVVARKFEGRGLACVPFEPVVTFRSLLAFGTRYQPNPASREFIGLLRKVTTALTPALSQRERE
ncbi:MAG TPA: LysR family transcriptional regulator [Ramlibacter sp.]|nr:LysR family transcriptional regulator [Ramlibacter sp.]